MKNEQPPRVDVVIVSYNSTSVIGSSLSTLPSWANTIVVDNDSSDDIASAIKQFRAQLISLDRNYGFGTGCNRGAESSNAPYILFLNPDASIGSDALDHLIEQMDIHTDWGALSPRILYPNGDEFFRTSSFFEPELGAPKKPDTVGEVYVLSGSVFLIRRSVFQELKGFDEGIFLFMEDDELSYRIRQSGYKIISDRRVSAVHMHGKSTTPSLKLELFKSFEAERSRLYVAKKHATPYQAKKQRWKVGLRLIRACLVFDLKRIAQNWGRLQALKQV